MFEEFRKTKDTVFEQPHFIMASSSLHKSILFALYLYLYTANAHQSLHLRNMTSDDVNAVTTTIVSAFDPGPVWTYMYQFRDRFPSYHWRCLRVQTERYYPNTPAEYANVIVPPEDATNSARSFGGWKLMRKVDPRPIGTRRRMSFSPFGSSDFEDLVTSKALYDVSHVEVFRQRMIEKSQAHITEAHQEANELELPCSLHLDMNLTRAIHLVSQFQAIEERYIYDAYEYQLYLHLLATHPDWDGHEFGAMQVKWGMQKAKAEEERLSQVEGRQIEIPVTLLATPAGYPLYKSLGFESVANVTLHLLDNFGGGTTWFEYMRWIPHAHA